MTDNVEQVKEASPAELLDLLADVEAHAELLRADKQAAVDLVITAEIKQKLADIDAEFSAKFDGIAVQTTALRAQITAAVLARGESVKGKYLQAVWSKPRVSWDTRALEGYAAAHPELHGFKKVGEPSVSFRGVK